MINPETLPPFILILSIVLFITGIVYKPVFIPAAFLFGWLSKLVNFYPVLSTIKFEMILGVGGLIVIFIKTRAFYRLSWSYNNVNKYFYLLLASMVLSFIFAWDHEYSWDIKLHDFIKVIILYFMLVMTLDDELDIKIFSFMFIALFIYLANEPVYYFLNHIAIDEEMYGATYIGKSGILSGHVALANNMNQMIPIALYLLIAEKNRYWRIVLSLALIFFFIALVGSKSRGGVAGLLFIAVVVTYFSDHKLRMAIIGGASVLLLFALNPDLGATLERIDSTASHGRFIGLTHGIEMLLKGNILGVGPGCYLIARSYYFDYYMESHNIYGQILGDLGIPGAIITFLFMKSIFSNLIQAKSVLRDGKDFIYYLSLGIQVSLIVRLFVSLGSHGLYFFYWYVMAALSIAVNNAALRDDEVYDEPKFEMTKTDF